MARTFVPGVGGSTALIPSAEKIQLELCRAIGDSTLPRAMEKEAAGKGYQALV